MAVISGGKVIEGARFRAGTTEGAGGIATADVADSAITSAKVLDGTLTAADLAAALAALIQGTPTFTVGAEAVDVINIAVQLKDSNGVALAAKHVVRAWLSDTAGAALSGTPPSGTVVIGTNGVIVASLTAKTHLVIITDASGRFDLNITEAGVKSFFLNVEYQGKHFSQGMTWA
jgi:hypothetical protein